MLPCLVEYLKATQQFPRPDTRFTSYLYKVYETIPPLVSTWYTIWAKLIVIVATYRRVVTEGYQAMEKRSYQSTIVYARKSFITLPTSILDLEPS